MAYIRGRVNPNKLRKIEKSWKICRTLLGSNSSILMENSRYWKESRPDISYHILKRRIHLNYPHSCMSIPPLPLRKLKNTNSPYVHQPLMGISKTLTPNFSFFLLPFSFKSISAIPPPVFYSFTLAKPQFWI